MYFNILLNIQHLSDPERVTVVITTAFFFHKGVWHHDIFVFSQTVKELDSHASRM